MSENLGVRVGRIISGGLNALVDAVEGSAPEVVMEQAIREIDDVIGQARRELGTAEANSHLATKRHAEESNRLEELHSKAELAIREGREDLAEVAVEETLDIEDQLPVLSDRVKELADEKAKLEGYIRALQSKKREMRTELQRFRESRKAQDSVAAGAGAHPAVSHAGRENRAERATSAFDRVLERQTGLHGVGSTDPARNARLSELDDVAHKNRVAERLALLKAGRAE